MLEIIGGSKIKGKVKISGSKNSSLPIICASLLTKGQVTLHNVPNISDVIDLLKILESLNVKVDFKNNLLKLDSSQIKSQTLNQDEVKKIRGSSYLLSVLLCLFKNVRMSFPGGCKLGDRNLDFHFNAFEKMGASVYLDDEINIDYKKLNGCNINFKKMSVGATINTIILAGFCPSPVKIYRYSKEPEVLHLIDFLKLIGYRIYLMNDYVLVSFHKPFKSKVEYKIKSDRIESYSYAFLGVFSKKLILKNVIHDELLTLYDVLDNMNAKYKKKSKELIIYKSNINGIDVVASNYPKFPTDAQPMLASILTCANGKSSIKDEIYKERFKYSEGLKAMGANLSLSNKLIIEKSSLTGAVVKGYDLRGCFSLLIAGAIAQGKTTILDGELAFRGYEDLVTKLTKIGVKIRLI